MLSGGGNFRKDETLDIDSSVLSRTVSHAPLAYLWSAGDIESADEYLEYLQDLGGRTGFLMDVTGEDDTSINEQLSEAGIVILGDGIHPERLHDSLHNRQIVIDSIEQAFSTGATIYAQGQIAPAFAAWTPSPMGLQPGLGWIRNAIIAAPYTDEYADKLKNWLQTMLPTAYGIGIERGSALALSPNAEVEVWGNQGVKIVLGQNLASGMTGQE